MMTTCGIDLRDGEQLRVTAWIMMWMRGTCEFPWEDMSQLCTRRGQDNACGIKHLPVQHRARNETTEEIFNNLICGGSL
jgi:hypothetical protein